MTPALVSIREVAQHFMVSERLIRNWMKQGRIPKNTYIHIGQTYRYDLNAVSQALLSDLNEDAPDTTWDEVSPEDTRVEVPDLDADEDY
jgi:transposase|tara:strand:+ start:192 stop:458 length:267 start_codon:yes stop_codon:yes gene_type:complete